MKPALHALAMSALLALAACSGSNTPTHFDTGGGGAVGGNGAGGTSSGSGSGSGSTGTSSSTTGGSTTGQPAGGSMFVNGFPGGSAQTALYTFSNPGGSSPSALTLLGLQNAYSCGQAVNGPVVGAYLRLQIQSPPGTVLGSGSYAVGGSDGGATVLMEEGEVFPDGGAVVDYTEVQGGVNLYDGPGANPLTGDLNINASGPFGAQTFSGTFSATACP